MNLVYKWDKYKYSIPAEVVGKHFEKIEKKYGELTSSNVLDSARSEKSPIHNLFEWDDTVAAEKYRLRQASNLIVNLSVEIEREDDKPITCRAYFDVTDKKQGSFINVESAFRSEESREIVLDRALRELKAFEQKYKNLKELEEVIECIEKVLKVG